MTVLETLFWISDKVIIFVMPRNYIVQLDLLYLSSYSSYEYEQIVLKVALFCLIFPNGAILVTDPGLSPQYTSI